MQAHPFYAILSCALVVCAAAGCDDTAEPALDAAAADGSADDSSTDVMTSGADADAQADVLTPSRSRVCP
jgi:hypothetical protein